MNNQLSDDKFDDVMRSLLNEAAIDDAAVKEIADSPTMWWGVQRRISSERSTKAPWPPVNAWRRVLMLGLPTAVAAAAIILALFVYRPVTETTQPVAYAPVSPAASTIEPAEATVEPAHAIPTSQRTIIRSKRLKHSSPVVERELAAALPKKSAEIKTDFIALSYARDPDSGQIVRVRVPSSMLVTLGVVGTVKEPTDMIDAEVLVGDDGLTRAIRFIHKQ